MVPYKTAESIRASITVSLPCVVSPFSPCIITTIIEFSMQWLQGANNTA
jgi:hypothetical protein